MAAGRGSRMKDLTEHMPKAMLRVLGKPLLEYKLEALPEEVTEVIIVVGYLGSVIHDHFGPEYAGKRLLYVEQENPTGGTAEALWKAEPVLKDRFFVMNGDNLYAPEDMRACLLHEWALVVQQTEHVRTGSVMVHQGLVTDIVENSAHARGAGFACTNLYLLDRRVFNYPPVQKAPGSSELGLPQTVVQAARDIPIAAVPATWWIEIKDPDALLEAEKRLRGSL